MDSPPSPALVAERMPPRRLYLGLEGRISRREFWLQGVLLLSGLGLLGFLLLGIAGLDQRVAEALVNLGLAWPALAVSVKRWHDRGKSGWWVLINLVPLVGWLWAVVETGFLRGTPGPNRYGDDPLAAEDRL